MVSTPAVAGCVSEAVRAFKIQGCIEVAVTRCCPMKRAAVDIYTVLWFHIWCPRTLQHLLPTANKIISSKRLGTVEQYSATNTITNQDLKELEETMMKRRRKVLHSWGYFEVRGQERGQGWYQVSIHCV